MRGKEGKGNKIENINQIEHMAGSVQGHRKCILNNFTGEVFLCFTK